MNIRNLFINIFKNRDVRRNAAESLEKQEISLLKNHLNKFKEYLKKRNDGNIQKIVFKIEQLK